RYFKLIIITLPSPLFYTQYIHLPAASDPVPSFISNSHAFFPYFKGALGAINGTYIDNSPPA
ncbi:hypothetical protein EDD18DRAFT_1027372, partial [Armillaria luteobubalina]